MALWSLINGTDLWSAAITKINNAINSYNGFNGGNLNQRLVKADTATDFYVVWSDPETQINSSTSVNIGTTSIGDSVELTLLYHAYNNYNNTVIKAFSLSSPTNYIVGKVTAVTVTTVLLSIIKVNGTGTFTDLVAVPYTEVNDKQYVVNQTTAVPNVIFGTVATIPNCTLNTLWTSLSQYGNLTTVSGFLQVTATSALFEKDILLGYLDSAYAIENGNSGQVVTGTASVSVKRTYLGVTENYSSVGWIDNYGGFNAYGATSQILYINFRETAPIATVAIGDVFSYNFSLTYISKAE